MAKRWYGSVNNRIDEGKYYNGTYKNLKNGDDITMYYWSDRVPYYIVRVVDQKDIFVKRYSVCADHHKEGGMGHQNWLYFRTELDECKYLNLCIEEGLLPESMYKNLNEVSVSKPEEWVYRYNKWQKVVRYDLNTWLAAVAEARKDTTNPDDIEKVENLAMYYSGLSKEEVQKIKNGKTVNRYSDLSGKVSFGYREYYYDWEF